LEVAVAGFVEPDKVQLEIIILIVIDMKGAQALRAAGQPVVAGLVLRCGAPCSERAAAVAGVADPGVVRPRRGRLQGLAARPALHDSATGSLSSDNSKENGNVHLGDVRMRPFPENMSLS